MRGNEDWGVEGEERRRERQLKKKEVSAGSIVRTTERLTNCLIMHDLIQYLLQPGL
jgi:hypothetical protein